MGHISKCKGLGLKTWKPQRILGIGFRDCLHLRYEKEKRDRFNHGNESTTGDKIIAEIRNIAGKLFSNWGPFRNVRVWVLGLPSSEI